MTRARLYFDDLEIGSTRETSHPAFVRVCEDELFYSWTDDFGPFGNDSGADTLRNLEDWYRAGSRGTLRSFIDGMLEAWGTTIPDLSASDRDTVNAWIEKEGLETFLTVANNLVIAVAFGAIKITGQLDAAVAALANAALDREAIMIENYADSWPHAATASAAIGLKRAALASFTKHRS